MENFESVLNLVCSHNSKRKALSLVFTSWFINMGSFLGCTAWIIAGVQYKTRNVLTDPELRTAIKEYRYVICIEWST